MTIWSALSHFSQVARVMEKIHFHFYWWNTFTFLRVKLVFWIRIFSPLLTCKNKGFFLKKMLGNMLRYIRRNIFSEQILQSGQSLILCPLCPVPELKSRILQYWRMRTGIMSPLLVFTFTFLELKLAMKMGIMSPHSVARKMEHFQKKILQCWQS